MGMLCGGKKIWDEKSVKYMGEELKRKPKKMDVMRVMSER